MYTPTKRKEQKNKRPEKSYAVKCTHVVYTSIVRCCAVVIPDVVYTVSVT